MDVEVHVSDPGAHFSATVSSPLSRTSLDVRSEEGVRGEQEPKFIRPAV
ncbi:hypothetical protein CCACVL1_06856 [Corchorus capsularis]|uniref:Uncharacterized protein n=1 Tax=Corchorus capsularis TaxID=210143 RepID=A0A1R3JC37_COCAP|nr:hypothetical protein CCACVL1_06856 [Corchorus capsularis]